MKRKYEFDLNLQLKNGHKVFNIKEEDEQSLVFNARLKTKQGFKNKIDSLSITSLIDNQKKSLLLFYLAYQYYKDIEEKKIPIIIDCKKLKNKDDSILFGCFEMYYI